jgi:uncharacterized protein (UPF0303 family)
MMEKGGTRTVLEEKTTLTDQAAAAEGGLVQVQARGAGACACLCA